MELAANFYSKGEFNIPQISIVDSTKATKEVIQHYKREREEGKPDSNIWNISVEAAAGIIDKKYATPSIPDNFSFRGSSEILRSPVLNQSSLLVFKKVY